LFGGLNMTYNHHLMTIPPSSFQVITYIASFAMGFCGTLI